jgi:pimeloyl-ACP methyl ester carboxylesterase
VLAAAGFRRDRLIVEKLAGFGHKGGCRHQMSPLASARRLVERLPAGRPLILVGHSASCQVVAHAARLVPERLSGLVLVGPTTDPRAATWPRMLARWLATAAHEPPWQLPTLVRQYRRTGWVGMTRTMDEALHDRIDLTLHGVTCPVLIVRGRHDHIAPARWVDDLVGDRRARGGRRGVTLRAGAHMLPLTHGELVGDAVAAFVSGLEPHDP